MWKGFVKAIAPFTPFVAEELWQDINGFTKWEKHNSVHLQPWSKYDDNQTAESVMVIPVMINGKVRGEIDITEDEDEKSVRSKIESHPKLQKYLEDMTITKFIYLPGKIASILLK
jgi:leucyl-tRNA synthetase